MLPPYYTLEIINPIGKNETIDNPISVTAARSFSAVGSLIFAIPQDYNEDLFPYNTRIKLWRTGVNYKKTLFGDTIWFLRKFRHRVSQRQYIIEAADSLTLLDNPLIAYTAQTPYADKTLEEFNLISYTDDFRIDNMMRQFVRENMASDALDASRINPLIRVEADRHFAPYGEKKAAWQKLSAALSDLARMSAEKGMELFYDLIPQSDDGYLFKVWRDVRGNDRGFNSVHSTIFSDQKNDLIDIEVTIDYSNMGTYCYVLGYDTGPSQVVVEIGNDDIIRSDPFGRVEFSHSGSESDVQSVLADAGRSALFGARPRRLLTATMSPASSLQYDIDFAYGDRVGAQANHKLYDCQVSAVRTEWQEGRERLDIRLDGSQTLWNPSWWEENADTTPTPIIPISPIYQPG